MDKINYRNLKLHPDGRYTINTKMVEEKLASLCAVCGRENACQFKDNISTLGHDWGAEAMITSCEEFAPIIRFAVTDGLETLDGPAVVNTIRLAGAWANRVKPGQFVVLEDNQGCYINHAKVVSSAHITKVKGLREHARDNHMLKGKNLSQAEASRQMRKILCDCYGGGFFKAAKKLSVIYLELE